MKPAILILLFPLFGCAVGRVAPGRTSAEIGTMKAAAIQSEDAKNETVQIVETETFYPAANVGLVERKKISTTIGAAQKNMAQEISAKLASVRWLQWLGAGMFLFGVASAVYPPLKLLVSSVTTSATIAAAGAAMMFAPLVIVGHEILILCAAAGAAGLWFFAHRHGEMRGELKAKNL
jgi:hypothetical protein